MLDPVFTLLTQMLTGVGVALKENKLLTENEFEILFLFFTFDCCIIPRFLRTLL